MSTSSDKHGQMLRLGFEHEGSTRSYMCSRCAIFRLPDPEVFSRPIDDLYAERLRARQLREARDAELQRMSVGNSDHVDAMRYAARSAEEALARRANEIDWNSLFRDDGFFGTGGSTYATTGPVPPVTAESIREAMRQLNAIQDSFIRSTALPSRLVTATPAPAPKPAIPQVDPFQRVTRRLIRNKATPDAQS